jgi:hypothetical protein
LYFVGALDPNLITKFKRTCQFTAEDYALLVRLFRWFGQVVTTPTILAEVNNLASQLPAKIVRGWRERFQVGVTLFSERYEPSAMLSATPAFVHLGLTDAAIVQIADAKLLALTDDLKLYVALQSAGLDAINFNHLRTDLWSP